MNNPFSGYGKPVFGDRLVGRERELGIIKNSMDNEGISLSIVGLRRIGKTSLILEAKRRTQKVKSVVAVVDFSVFPSARDFFEGALDEICEELKQLPADFNDIISDPVDSNYNAYRKFRQALKVLRRNGIFINLIIDEFDAVRLIEGSNQVIKWIRELIDKGEHTGFSAIFVSRRTLYAIEKQTASVSNLDGVCQRVNVQPLKSPGMQQILRRGGFFLADRNIAMEKLREFTGGYPYLTEMILCNWHDAGEMSEGINGSLAEIIDFYNHLLMTLEEDNLLEQLRCLLFGTGKKQITIAAKQSLISYGLIREMEGSAGYCAFSKHFEEYLAVDP